MMEDDINEYLRQEKSEESKGNDLKNNDTKRQAKKQNEWKMIGDKFAKSRSNKI